MALCEVMAEHEVKSLVFSSSATVYGDPHQVPIREEFPLSATNPYGRSEADGGNPARCRGGGPCVAGLRCCAYFNPVGGTCVGNPRRGSERDPEQPDAVHHAGGGGKRPELSVFGNDHATPDGTGVRDYIHVVDLARGHLAAWAH